MSIDSQIIKHRILGVKNLAVAVLHLILQFVVFLFISVENPGNIRYFGLNLPTLVLWGLGCISFSLFFTGSVLTRIVMNLFGRTWDFAKWIKAGDGSYNNLHLAHPDAYTFGVALLRWSSLTILGLIVLYVLMLVTPWYELSVT